MVSNKKWLSTLVLCFILGTWGAHRFYVGKPITAILMILTGGGLGIWNIVDFILIAIGKFKDGEGNIINPSLYS